MYTGYNKIEEATMEETYSVLRTIARHAVPTEKLKVRTMTKSKNPANVKDCTEASIFKGVPNSQG